MQAPVALKFGLDIDWVFSESCIITWKEGDLSKNLGLGTQPATMWFGAKQEKHIWIIMLQTTISFKISDRAVAFDFFTFVDPHSILFERNPIHILPDIPSQLLAAHSAKQDQEWLTASIKQNKQQSFGRVLMQMQSPNNKPWEGMPFCRLRELKSLSDAPGFSIYLANKRNVRKFINRLQNELPKILAPVYINLNVTYEGRGGAWDAWGLYNDELVSLPNLPETTGIPPSDQVAAPPIYSKTDPNVTHTPEYTPTTTTAKRRCDTQEGDLTHKKFRDDRALQWAWHNTDYPLGSPTEENTLSSRSEQLTQQSTGDGHSREKDKAQRRQGVEGRPREEREVTQFEGARSSPNISVDDQSTQGQTPPPYLQLTDINTPTPDRPCTPARSNCYNPRSVQTPPYAPSFTSAVSLDQVDIKPTIFTTRPQIQHPSSITLPISELESLIANTIRAQIPLIAAHVQTHNLTTELTAWAQPSIADYIAIHMPAIMHEAASAHVSDVNDEFESASAALHETKEDAVTEIRDAEDSGIQGVHRESQIAIDDLQEQSQRLSDALTDKCTELEDRLDAKISSSATPEYSRQSPIGLSSVQEAVKVFERFHRGRLTSNEQVRVLLSIAKFNNAEVFMTADLESRKMLVAYWSGTED